MKFCEWTLLAALLAGLSVSVAVAAETAKTAPKKSYDVATEATIQGTVEKVDEAKKPGLNGLILKIVSAGQSHNVFVGPADYASKNGFVFAAGDKLEVTGARTGTGAAERILAREVKKDGKTLSLRTPQGAPKWSSEKPKGPATRVSGSQLYQMVI